MVTNNFKILRFTILVFQYKHWVKYRLTSLIIALKKCNSSNFFYVIQFSIRIFLGLYTFVILLVSGRFFTCQRARFKFQMENFSTDFVLNECVLAKYPRIKMSIQIFLSSRSTYNTKTMSSVNFPIARYTKLENGRCKQNF